MTEKKFVGGSCSDPVVSPNACKELAERAGEQLRRRLASEKGR